MNDRRMLHPTYILFGVLSVIKGFLPVMVIVLLRKPDWSNLGWYWYAGVGGFLVLMALIAFLQWKKFGFWLEEDRIIIRSGLFFRQEKTIYYTRIHSVNIEQPLIQRILGVVQLKIETPGGNNKADGTLETLSKDEANRIKQLLRSYSEAGAVQAKNVIDREVAVVGNEGDGQEDFATVSAAVDQQLAPSVTLSSMSNEGTAGPSVGAAASNANRQEEAGPSVTLDAGKLFQAAATSLNFGLAIAFIAGLYSFADDFLNLIFPEHFFEQVVEDSVNQMSNAFFIAGLAIFVILFAWVLSILLYILKYSGFTMRRDGKQLSLTYGLLEKKSILFDPKNVQAVIVNESWLRQIWGYGEVKLQVVSSDKQEQLMLHPFIKVSEVQALIDQFVPGMKLPEPRELAPSPRKALIYYIRIPLLLAVVLTGACIAYFGAIGAWSLLLIPIVLWWRISCHKAAGLLLEDGQLTLRRRTLQRITYYVRRPRIVTMSVKRSDAQRRKGIAAISVHVLGSPFSYKVPGMDHSDVQPVWSWYSRSGKTL
ncbi:PH domain-containing protein [Paenibacillus sp. NPDC057967]|uniref:PH domain-containing protein n=1 Tax=Paenibacillus sp. NPDC057967 TaxID=3346293 RepID=UPI0036DD4E10